MTTKLFTLCVGALALGASACAQTTLTAANTWTPGGRAAQPGSWNRSGDDPPVVSTGEQRGQAAEPGAWPEAGLSATGGHAYASVGSPRGQAAQPSAWARVH